MAGVAELAQEFGRADERGVVYLDTAGRSIIPQSVLDVGTAALGLKVGAWVHWVAVGFSVQWDGYHYVSLSIRLT